MSRRVGDFWTARKVAWYRRALEQSDYADRVLAALEPALAGCGSALDVGAGCGALAVPLARRLSRVTALEPAPAMAEALRGIVAAGGLANLTTVEAAWGQVSLPPHDLVVCAHVGELLRPGTAFLSEASRVARRAVALVRDVAVQGDKFFFAELYPRLLGRPYGGGGDPTETLDALAALAIHPQTVEIDYRSDQPFDDLEDACDFWQEYLELVDPGTRRFLRGFLASRLVRTPTGWVAPYRKRALIAWWTMEPAS